MCVDLEPIAVGAYVVLAGVGLATVIAVLIFGVWRWLFHKTEE